jgi:hypothetical protein
VRAVPDTPGPEPLTREVAAVLEAALFAAVDPRAAAVLAAARRRLDEPLRVAIAGRVKAGKSTLLNALLGVELAPTDAGECTRIVTWYQRAPRPEAILHPRSGPPSARPFTRADRSLAVDIGGVDHDDVDHLTIGWPTARLAQLTVIDTPGIASLSTEVSARTLAALAPEDAPTQADAVIYLLRHAHTTDLRFLEAFQADELVHGTSMNAVGVLARADEIGSARSDAMQVAAGVAAHYQADPRLRRLCPLVVAVSGLMGVAAETLRDEEYRTLAALAAEPVADVTALLLTAERFARRPGAVPLDEREWLLERLGLYGVRMAVDLVRRGVTPNPPALRVELGHHSGLPRLRAVLLAQFTRRARVLKARTALATLNRVLASGGVRRPEAFAERVEAIAANAHAFVEVRLLAQLHAGLLEVRADREAELERLLGGHGHDPASRLGVPADTPPDELSARADEAIGRWRTRASHPLATRPQQHAYEVVVRSLEGLLAELDAAELSQVR